MPRSPDITPPLPDPGGARKPRRFWLFAPFVLLAIGIAGWSLVWLRLSNEATGALDRAADRWRAAGYDLAWDQRRVSGYPFRIDLTLTDLRIRTPEGWAASTPQLEAEAFVHAPTHWVFGAPKGLSFTRPLGGPVEVTGATLHASLHDIDKRPPSLSLEGIGLQFAPGPGARPFALAAADRVELHLRPGPDDQGAVLFKVTGGKASPAGVLAHLAGQGQVGMVWDSLLSHTSAFTGDGWAKAAGAWARGGGAIQVRQAGLTAGDASIGAQGGALHVDADGRLAGAIEVTLRQAPRALAALAQDGRLSQDAAIAAGAVAVAHQEQGDAARLNLTFEAGRTTLGPVAVGPAPKVF